MQPKTDNLLAGITLTDGEVEYFRLLHRALTVLVEKIEARGYKNENVPLDQDGYFLQLKAMAKHLYDDHYGEG